MILPLMTAMMSRDCSSDPASSLDDDDGHDDDDHDDHHQDSSDPASSLDEFSAHRSRSSSSSCSPVYTSGNADHANNDHADHADYDDYDHAITTTFLPQAEFPIGDTLLPPPEGFFTLPRFSFSSASSHHRHVWREYCHHHHFHHLHLRK